MVLSSDKSFHFNLLRWLGTAPYHGVDIVEMLNITTRIAPSDFESWYLEFYGLALDVQKQKDSYSPSPVQRPLPTKGRNNIQVYTGSPKESSNRLNNLPPGTKTF
ncbi:hypothetical protein BC749_10949 [Flavobacterium araucananum]|uniref:Uncharacterized protein n=1 Tax=Flavobacterium araucananum TaxID=946678 RepID=A0A227P577_9FLAO|nr:hypothetical protein B0A64_13585 [Flavobacterium araucananum]PWJ96773.1 hypothetical protein BC749_10949 [Flavobacterium araucananum]